MQRIVLICLFFLFTTRVLPQSGSGQLVQEGIALHDMGKYDAAIEKYNAAINLDPLDYFAIYEKSYSLMALRKFEEAEDLLKKILKECKEEQYRTKAYVNYGTLLDYQGKAKKSVDMYDKGIREYPLEQMLYFNKGITLSGMQETEKAVDCFKQSVRLNPLHASSHNALGRMLMNSNRIAAVMSFFTFLLMEPEGERALQNYGTLNKLFMKGVSKGEDGSIVIGIDALLPDKKKKKEEDDFSAEDMLVSLLGASLSGHEDSLGIKTEADRLSYKMQLLIGMIDEKKGKGFYREFYMPMLAEIKEKNLLTTACYIVMTSSGDPEIKQWLADNQDKVDEFYTWFKFYKWDGGK
ncbi:MAG: tetratricopeptide repeat protein [Terrimonas sp.]|nr:tetratricopeptide repeat protein [Terrimonas sp.]